MHSAILLITVHVLPSDRMHVRGEELGVDGAAYASVLGALAIPVL